MYIMPFNPRYDVAPKPAAPLSDAARQRQEPMVEAIIQAASEVFARQGYAATRVQSIAQRAGIPKSNVLYYFKSKDNLYSQVLARIAVPYLDACSAFQHQEQPLEALARHLRSLAQLFQAQPFGAKVLMAELAAGALHLPQEYAERWHAQAQQCVAALSLWIDQGLLVPADPQHLLITLWALAQSCVSLGWQMPRVLGKEKVEATDFSAALDTAIQLMLGGFAPVARLAPNWTERLPA